MLVCIIVYICVFAIIAFVLNKKSQKIHKINNVKVVKNGLIFKSNYRHYIYISNAKFLILDNQVFLRGENNRVVIKNVANVEQIENKLYFTCLGNVEILFDNREFFRYFNIIIFAEKFNLNSLKNKASLDMLYYPFDYKNKRNFMFYIKVVENILRLSFKQNEVRVKANKYFLPFKLVYRLNGKIRQVNFSFK